MDKIQTLNTDYVRTILKERPREMHKGDAGRVLIVAGSKGMAGACVLTARGTLYSGAGLVTLAVPDELLDILQISVPEAMCVERAGICKSNGFDFSRYDAIAIGPGLGVSEENYKLICEIVGNFSGRIVIDADGLNCLSMYGWPQILNREKSCTIVDNDIVITPHPGEAARILNSLKLPVDPYENRVGALEAIAIGTNSKVLLKGADTLIYDGFKFWENPTGNPGMATGGSGDVLTGIIAGLMAQKYLFASAMECACAGAFIHGLAGDIAAENIGEYGMTSADIADAVSVAIKELTG